MSELNPISFLQTEVSELKEFEHRKKDRLGGLAAFWQRTKSAVRLILSEPEILLFAVLQWVVIGVAYFLWTEILAIIPDEVWVAASQDNETGSNSTWLPSLILLIWSFVIVGIAALPLGILSACMGAALVLKRTQQESTIAACLKLTASNAYSLWIFQWIDGWITVNQIMERLPRKNDRRSAAEIALGEALYYAWKIGSAGMLPGMVIGKSLVPAGKSSIDFVRRKFTDIALLRTGYSSLCWLLGVGTYFGALILLPDHVLSAGTTSDGIASFFYAVGVPLMVALIFVVTMLRPIYVVAMSDLYVDYLKETNQEIDLGEQPSKFGGAIVAWCIMAAALLAAFIFRDQLGITEWLSHIST